MSYILTGPYYEEQNPIEGPSIKHFTYRVPSGYWKIIAIWQDNMIKTVSFIFPQETSFHDNYCDHLALLSQIEDLTGLKFFPDQIVCQEQALTEEIGCDKREIKARNKNLSPWEEVIFKLSGDKVTDPY